MGNGPNMAEFFKNLLTLLFGAVLCFSMFLFAILSTPVYLFRLFVSQLAKILRNDLDSIMDVTSSAMINDYFTKTPPRDNAILCIHIQGHLTTAELKSLVHKSWINCRDPITGEQQFKRFQQYPERWLGFTFWKKGNNEFSIDNHVKQFSDKDTPITNEQLSAMLDKLMNYRWPKQQSTWEFSVIENYKKPTCSAHHSVVIFNFHHSLSDGYGLFSAMFEGILKFGKLEGLKLPQVSFPERSTWQKMCYIATIPINVFFEFGSILAHQFNPGPWVMPDHKKKWRQISTITEPILVEDIKDIKNKLGVSFTSVLHAGVSAAINRTLKRNGVSRETKPMLCVSTLPSGLRKSKELSNQVTAVVFGIPVSDFKSPVDRLKNIDKNLQRNKGTTVPLVLQYFGAIMGGHFYYVCEILARNRCIPMGLSNVPGLPYKFDLNGKECVHYEAVAGGLQGDTGMTVGVVSYDKVLTIGITVEEGLMSKEELELFGEWVTEEIKALGKLAKADK